MKIVYVLLPLFLLSGFALFCEGKQGAGYARQTQGNREQPFNVPTASNLGQPNQMNPAQAQVKYEGCTAEQLDNILAAMATSSPDSASRIYYINQNGHRFTYTFGMKDGKAEALKVKADSSRIIEKDGAGIYYCSLFFGNSISIQPQQQGRATVLTRSSGYYSAPSILGFASQKMDTIKIWAITAQEPQ